MSLTEEERKIIVGLELEKARKAFAQTAELRKLGYWDTVANRLYYAVFHAVSALLIRDGHKVNTHKGAISAFGLNYIRTGVLPQELGRLYSDLQIMRNNSDYNCSYDVTREEIEPKIEQAERFIARISELVGDI